MRGDIADWSLETFLLASLRNITYSSAYAQGGKRLPQSELISPPQDRRDITPDRTPIAPAQRGEQKGWKQLDKLFGA